MVTTSLTVFRVIVLQHLSSEHVSQLQYVSSLVPGQSFTMSLIYRNDFVRVAEVLGANTSHNVKKVVFETFSQSSCLPPPTKENVPVAEVSILTHQCTMYVLSGDINI